MSIFVHFVVNGMQMGIIIVVDVADSAGWVAISGRLWKPTRMPANFGTHLHFRQAWALRMRVEVLCLSCRMLWLHTEFKCRQTRRRVLILPLLSLPRLRSDPVADRCKIGLLLLLEEGGWEGLPAQNLFEN